MGQQSDSEFEPIPGLPEELPEGERVIWQGRPDWRALARNVFKLKWLAIYFAVFAAARTVMAGADGEGAAGAMEVGKVIVLSLVGIGILGVLALKAMGTSCSPSRARTGAGGSFCGRTCSR